MSRLDDISPLELLNLIPNAFMVCDEELQIIGANKQVVSTLERPSDDFLNKSLSKILSLPDNFLLDLKKLTPSNSTISTAVLQPLNEVESIEIEIHGHYVSATEGSFRLLQLVNLSEQAQTIQTLQQLGRILGSLGHDISNPMAVIKLQTDTFKILASQKDNIPSDDVIKRMKTIGSAMDKLGENVNDLKTWAKDLSGLSLPEISTKMENYLKD